MRTHFAMIALASLASTSFGLSPTGLFTGTLNEDFESFADYNDLGWSGYSSLAVMGGGATFYSPGTEKGTWVYDVVTAGWSLGGNGAALVTSGQQGAGLYNHTYVTLDFTSPVKKFGGYFATTDFASFGNFNLDFYDGSGVLIGSDAFATPSNAMVWMGWADDGGIGKVVMSGNTAPVMDDLTASPVPEPASLLVLGLGVLALRRRR